MDSPIEIAIIQDLSLPIHPDLTRSIETKDDTVYHYCLMVILGDLVVI
jgi:hypothetical protein